MSDPHLIADRFSLIRSARAGGVGTVYRAIDGTTGATVALKLLATLDEATRERFRREAAALAALDHPGIVRYLAHGVAEPWRCWLAMEWLEGEELGDRLDRGVLSVADAIALGRQVCAALQHAHAHGIVHRDLKPSNLLCAHGASLALKLVDFGIARVAGAATLTGAGRSIGTPGYMAPEQVRGEPHVDGRADLFALGCVLWASLTGESPFFSEERLASLARAVVEVPPDVSERRPDVPAALAELVARLLDKDPARRPASAAEVEAALAAVVLGAAESAPPARAALGRLERAHTCVLALRHDAPVAAAAAIAARHGTRFEPVPPDLYVAEFRAATSATDAAVRAVRCALALRALAPGATMALATGPTLVPGADSGGAAVERALRLLQSAAAPALVLDDASAGLVGGQFELRPGEDGARVLEGERAAGEVRRLLGRTTRCHGRERELKALLGLYRACAAEPRAGAMLVTAAAGGGKTRLRLELERELRARDDHATVWVAAGDPMRSGAPLGLFAEIVRRAAGVRDDDPAPLQRERLAAHVASRIGGDDAARVAAFLGEGAGIPFPDEHSPLLRAARRDPRLMSERLHTAWEDWLAAESAAAPLVLVLEDLHWGDYATLKLVDRVLRNLAGQPIMVLALARPEVHEQFPNLWQERGLEQLELRPLPGVACGRLVREVLGDDTPAAVVERLTERSAGNAFYLEELIRATARGQDGELPGSVLAMVQARFASLSEPLRRALRAASVFGEAVWSGGVGALIEAPARPLLDALVAEEWLRPRAESRFRGETELGFDHALVREAAYAALTDADRELGHRRAAHWLEAAGATDPVMLGEHWERAHEPARAATWFHRAAQRALDADDTSACSAHADHAIACGAAGESLGELLLLQAEASNWHSDHERALELARRAAELLRPRSSSWAHALHQAMWAASAAGLAAAVTPLARTLGDAIDGTEVDDVRTAIAVAYGVQNMRMISLGAEADALERAGTRLSEAVREDLLVRCAHAFSRGLQAGMARPDRGLEAWDEALALARAAGSTRDLVTTLSNRACALDELGDFEAALADLRECVRLLDRSGLEHLAKYARTNVGMVLTKLGELDAARRELEAVTALGAGADNDRIIAYAYIYLAQVQLLAGEHAAALAEARTAVARSRQLPPVLLFAQAVEAQALLALGRTDEALVATTSAAQLLDAQDPLPEGGELARLVHAEAVHASGDAAGARALLAAQKARLLTRAAVFDETSRTRWLTRSPVVARVMALARTWHLE